MNFSLDMCFGQISTSDQYIELSIELMHHKYMIYDRQTLTLTQKFKLFQYSLYQAIGSNVDKAGYMEVKTRNYAQLNEHLKTFFNTQQWELIGTEQDLKESFLQDTKEAGLDILNNEGTYLLYKSKRGFFTFKDEQVVDVRVFNRKEGFIGITISATIPRQNIFNKYKKLNDKIIINLKNYLQQFYQIDNFDIDFHLDSGF